MLEDDNLEALARSENLTEQLSHHELKASFLKLTELYNSSCQQLLDMNSRCRVLENVTLSIQAQQRLLKSA